MTNLLNAAQLAEMRSTVLNVQLDMVCTIQRPTPGAEDPYGQKPSTWANHLVGVACHYWEESDVENVGDPNALITKERIVLAANSDVTPNDRVLTVTGIDGVQVAGVLAIREVISQITGTILMVRSIR